MVLQVTVNKPPPNLTYSTPDFNLRRLEVTFVRSGNRTFAESSGANQVTVSDLRISAKIVKAGGNSMGAAQLEIYGMTLSLMNQLATLGMRISLVPRDTVIVKAGVAGQQTPLTPVYTGTITAAWADFESMPDVPFRVEAHSGLDSAVVSVPPISFKGSVPVAYIMSQLASQMQKSFENNGVTARVVNPYYWGSALNQMRQCAKEANINAFVDDNILAIWPVNGSRSQQGMPLISPQTGLIGYPTFTAEGIALRTLFNPLIKFGAKIQLQSSLTPACGVWTVALLSYDLDAQVPHGKWACGLSVYNFDLPDQPPLVV